MSDQYAWRVREGRTDTDVLLVGTGGRRFWEEYGGMVSIVSWEVDDV